MLNNFLVKPTIKTNPLEEIFERVCFLIYFFVIFYLHFAIFNVIAGAYRVVVALHFLPVADRIKNVVARGKEDKASYRLAVNRGEDFVNAIVAENILHSVHANHVTRLS